MYLAVNQATLLTTPKPVLEEFGKLESYYVECFHLLHFALVESRIGLLLRAVFWHQHEAISHEQ